MIKLSLQVHEDGNKFNNSQEIEPELAVCKKSLATYKQSVQSRTNVCLK